MFMLSFINAALSPDVDELPLAARITGSLASAAHASPLVSGLPLVTASACLLVSSSGVRVRTCTSTMFAVMATESVVSDRRQLLSTLTVNHSRLSGTCNWTTVCQAGICSVRLMILQL